MLHYLWIGLIWGVCTTISTAQLRLHQIPKNDTLIFVGELTELPSYWKQKRKKRGRGGWVSARYLPRRCHGYNQYRSLIYKFKITQSGPNAQVEEEILVASGGDRTTFKKGKIYTLEVSCTHPTLKWNQIYNDYQHLAFIPYYAVSHRRGKHLKFQQNKRISRKKR